MRFIMGAALAVVLAACSAVEQGTPEPATDSAFRVRLAGEGNPVTSGALADLAVWRDPADPGSERLLAAAEGAGIIVYAADGREAGQAAELAAHLVEVVPDFAVGGERAPLVLVYEGASSTVGAWRLDAERGTLRQVIAAVIEIDDEAVGLCHYRSRLSGSDYVYAVTDGGLVHHYELYAAEDAVRARLLRSIASGKGSGACAVDPRDGMLYLAEEGSGIWRIAAEPETDPVREPVDLRAPFGALSDDVKGLAVRPAGDRSWLLVSDAGEARLALYGLPEGERLGFVTFDGLEEVEAIAAAGEAFALADEEEGGVTRLKLLAYAELGAVANLAPGGEDAEAAAAPPVVRPVLETATVGTWGDAADDPAIWLHPEDPQLSLVLGTDKKHGLIVYDLDGQILQVLADGNLNNVDLRYGFALGGAAVDLVTASNRSTGGISVYRIDPAGRRLVETAAGILPTGFVDPYGACMYASPAGEFYVFVNEGDTGLFRQWRLHDDGSGRVAAEQVREFPVGSQAEGCVADDETGDLYIAEEDGGLWKYAAEPDGGSARTLIDTTGDEGRLTADIEGVALWHGENGRGYLVVSNQGADNYAVYRREGDNAYVGHFHIVANPGLGIDGASETDGLEVTSAALGPRFPAGLLVVQDGRNIAPREKQNFKYVSWQDVATALGLD